MVTAFPVSKAWRDMRCLNQHAVKRLASPNITADGQGTDRIAVIALAARDEPCAFFIAALNMVLARHLQGRLNGFRSARDKIYRRNIARRLFHKQVGQSLGRFGGEKSSVSKSQGVQLSFDRGNYIGIAVAETGHGRTARSVEIFFSAVIKEVDPLASDSEG